MSKYENIPNVSSSRLLQIAISLLT